MAERDENRYAVIAIGSSVRSYYEEVEFSDVDSILEGIALCTKWKFGALRQWYALAATH